MTKISDEIMQEHKERLSRINCAALTKSAQLMLEAMDGCEDSRDSLNLLASTFGTIIIGAVTSGTIEREHLGYMFDGLQECVCEALDEIQQQGGLA